MTGSGETGVSRVRSGLPPEPPLVEFALTGDDLIASQFNPQSEDLAGFVEICLYRKFAIAPRGHKHGQAGAGEVEHRGIESACFFP
jgi:hypothetical protein